MSDYFFFKPSTLSKITGASKATGTSEDITYIKSYHIYIIFIR